MLKLNLIFVISIVLGFTCLNGLEGQDKPKVALLFLTRGELNQSALWQKMLEQHSDKFNVYIHSKEKIRGRYFSQFVIKNRVETSRTFHVKAWVELFKAALTNRENVKFVLLSESCFPLQDLDTIYQQLTSNANGYVSYRRPFWPKTHKREVIEIAPEHRWVSSEWVILNRGQARLVAKDRTVIEACSKHPSDAESYFPMLLSYYAKLDSPKVVTYNNTYVDWKHRTGSHPYTFSHGSEWEKGSLLEAKAEGYLFVRKIAASFPKDFLSGLSCSD